MSSPATELAPEKAPLFPLDKKTRRIVIDPLSDNNPITVQVLGICSAVAVEVAELGAKVFVFPMPTSPT